MEKEKIYELIRFSPNVIQEGYQVFLTKTRLKKSDNRFFIMQAETNNETWSFDNLEEFYSEIRRKPQQFFLGSSGGEYAFHLYQFANYVRISVKAPSRQLIESVFDVFERNLEESKIENPNLDEAPKIFIGHGRNQQWRDLKDHLHEQHGFKVEAYEIGARAGHTIRDILETMLEESNFAILVLTAEDEDIQGHFHPRLNIVHELGLFQGHLGFSKAIALVEDGTEEFSNIHGIQQIRFAKGKIRETYGDVLATIRRECYEEGTACVP